ncbi:hypothetical protein N9Z70_01410 [Mariniblastus sp.]|nr:hypothetical protein [Mariniblastus sp.]
MNDRWFRLGDPDRYPAQRILLAGQQVAVAETVRIEYDSASHPK